MPARSCLVVEMLEIDHVGEVNAEMLAGTSTADNDVRHFHANALGFPSIVKVVVPSVGLSPLLQGLACLRVNERDHLRERPIVVLPAFFDLKRVRFPLQIPNSLHTLVLYIVVEPIWYDFSCPRPPLVLNFLTMAKLSGWAWCRLAVVLVVGFLATSCGSDVGVEPLGPMTAADLSGAYAVNGWVSSSGIPVSSIYFSGDCAAPSLGLTGLRPIEGLPSVVLRGCVTQVDDFTVAGDDGHLEIVIFDSLGHPDSSVERTTTVELLKTQAGMRLDLAYEGINNQGPRNDSLTLVRFLPTDR